MKTRLKINLTVIALMLFGVSCNDEDLKLVQVSPNGPSTDGYWINLDRTESTLTSAYNGLLNHNILGVIHESLRSDLAWPVNRPNPSGPGQQWYYQQFLNSDTYVTRRWESQYKVIFYANQVIEGLNNLPEEARTDKDRWAHQMAQARFLRGLMHFYLHEGFNNGEIIIRDHVPQTLADFNKGTSSSEDVINFFRSDLKYAYDNLPAFNTNGEGAYRATAGAAATALGTSYLYEDQYDSAIAVFQDVINNPVYGYELADHSVLFTDAGENSSEAIFEINYSVEVKPEDSQWLEESLSNRLERATVLAGNERFTPSAWLTDAYQNEPLNTQDSRNFVNGNLRPVSLRASQMIALVQDTVTSYYLKPSVPEGMVSAGLNIGGCFSYFKKYSHHDLVDNPANYGASSWFSGRNITVMRLADVYLMLAESLIRGNGDITGALELINRVRDRWALRLLGPDLGTGDDYDGVTYTEATLMGHLMYVERPLELAIEGHSIRTLDLRRWGITKQRFEELSQEVYYLENFDYKDSDGATQTKSKFLLTKGTPSGNQTVVDYEYDQAATNYIESIHSYLPIPLDELRNNSSL